MRICTGAVIPGVKSVTAVTAVFPRLRPAEDQIDLLFRHAGDEHVIIPVDELNMLITAIGVSLLLQNLGLVAFGAIDTFPALVPQRQWNVAGVIISSNNVMILGTTLVLMVLLHHIVERTQIGRAMRAVSHSRDAAALMGIPVDRVIAFTFAIGSVLAAAAALLVAMDKGVIQPQMGAAGGG